MTSSTMETTQKKRRRPFLTRNRLKVVEFYAFITPWLLGFLVLTALPLLGGFGLSLTNFDGLNIDSMKFLGFGNYVRAFEDRDAVWTFTRSFVWAGLNVPIWLAASFLLAMAMDQPIKGRGLYRTLCYLPSVVPLIGSVYLWRILLNPNFGAINRLISIFRPGTAIHWTQDYALLSLTFISVWNGLGSGMVVFLAGLQGIPIELKEAARIDGANTLQVFRHVTIPLMTPVIFFQLVMSIISAMQSIAPAVLNPASTGRGANFLLAPRSVYVLAVHAYREAFTYSRFGYGTALVWILFVVLLALTILVFKTSQHWVYTEMEG